MVKTNKPGAVAGLQELVSTLPADQDARSDFFLSWKNRAVTTLELIFQDDPQPVQQFKEIEFSPRRLTNDEVRDAQLKLDAFLAGCAAARTLLESLLWRLSSADKSPAADGSPAPLLTVARHATTTETPAPPRPKPKPSAPPARTTDPWVITDPAHAPEQAIPDKPIMSPDVVLLPPNPVQVEAMKRAEAEKAAREKAAKEKVHREKAERERLEREQAERELAARELAEREKAEREKAEREQAKREKAEREKAERERIQREEAEKEAQAEEARREARRQAARQHNEERHAETEKARRKSKRQPHADEAVIAGASMDSRDLSGPVRSSLARMLGAWEKGDRDAAAVVSAQLLADLSLLAHHKRFKAAFETVVTRAFAPEEAEKAVEMLNGSGPLCAWSMIAAINEVMKN